MNIERFIDRLEKRGLLDKTAVDELRRKIAQSKGKQITPEVITKYLFDKGYLTRFQATKLINEITSVADSEAERQESSDEDDDELTVLPDEPETAGGDRPASGDKERKPAGGRDDLDELLAIDDEENELREREGGRKQASAEKGGRKKRSAGRPEAERDVGETQPQTPPPAPPVSVDEPLETFGGADDELGADLESSSAMLSEGGASSGLRGMFGGGGSQRGPRRKLEKSSEWDSVLLLVGGASIGVLLIVGGFLYLSLTRGAAEDLFSAAETAYEEESYSLAIKRYDKFLEDYSGHEKASMARVKRGAAQLRQVFKEPERGLKVAREELPAIKKEKAFSDIRPELASMLPRIARGFVDQAMLADDPAVQESLLQQTAKAMELVNDPEYIPNTLRKSQQTTIERINADVKRVQREIDRDRTLVESVKQIKGAVAAGDTQAAYQARQTLLNEYPGLDTNERLHEAVLAISEKEREKVQRVQEPLSAAADEQSSVEHRAVILSHGRGRAAGGANDGVVFVLAGGAVFALDASNGNVLWHRFVGVETTAHPFPVSTSPGADAIVVDRGAESVMRLAARTGEEVWRFDVGEPFADPVRLNHHVHVACESGRLLPLDIESGDVTEHVRVPQPLEVGPGVSVRRPQLYQPGDQDNLYVIDSETLECREVFYIGHKRGTIAVPPVLAFGYLFVLENSGPDFSDLHIIRYDQDGLNLKPARSTVRLQGQVLVPPVVGRRRVLVATDRRAVKLYDVEQDGVTAWEGLHGTDEDPILSYPLLKGGYMWVANDQLAKYQVQATTGELPAEWAVSERDVYVGPLRRVRDTVIHIRRRQGASGYTVGATHINEKTPSWETELAVPLRNIVVDGDSVETVNSRGRLFEITKDVMENGVVRKAKTSALRDERLILSLSEATRVRQGEWALSPPSEYNQVVFHRTTQDGPELKMLTLTVPLDQPAIEPTPFADGLLVPLHDGRVVLVDPTTGADQVRPFHPEIEPATEIGWHRAAVAADGEEFLIANDAGRIYRVGIAQDPEPHLAELGSVTVADQLVGPPASVGESLFVTTRAGDRDALICFTLPDLEEAERWPLTQPLRWGPKRVGELVLVSTDTELMCLDAQREQRWSVPWEHGPVVGAPLLLDQQLLLATDSGTVLALDPVEGKVTGTVEVGEPLDWGPVVFQDQLLVAGQSGVLFFVARPSS